jgi:DNA polymerase III alpha subunit
VSRYVTNTYGTDRVAQIVTFGESAQSTRVFRDRGFAGHEHGAPALP